MINFWLSSIGPSNRLLKPSGRVLIAATLVASTVIAAPAVATPASGFVATPIAKGVYDPMHVKGDKTGKWDLLLRTKGVTDLYVTRNAIAVDGQSGWHTHPGPSLITVTKGTITAYDSHNPLCTPVVYRAGQGFVDSGDHAHLLRNESGAPAETVAVQFLPTGAERRIDASMPNNCKF